MTTHIETRIEFVVRKLREAMPKNWPEISAQSGVPPATIYKIAYRDTKDPRGSTLDALYNHFADTSKRSKSTRPSNPPKESA